MYIYSYRCRRKDPTAEACMLLQVLVKIQLPSHWLTDAWYETYGKQLGSASRWSLGVHVKQPSNATMS